MTADEGVRRLVLHTTPGSASFLGMLRPYRGLEQQVLADVSDSLKAAAPKISDEHLPRELVSALWAISYYGRWWALDPEGMLRRNNLISDADLTTLARSVEPSEAGAAGPQQ